MALNLDRDKIKDILRIYKFDNKSLDKTIKSFFVLAGYSSACVDNSDNERSINEFAWKLVDYKFNKYPGAQDKLIDELILWLDTKGSRLRSSTSYLIKEEDDIFP